MRQLRKERGWSQEELGHRARVHRNAVGGIEAARYNPTFSTLVRLAAALEVRLSELLRLAEDVGPDG